MMQTDIFKVMADEYLKGVTEPEVKKPTPQGLGARSSLSMKNPEADANIIEPIKLGGAVDTVAKYYNKIIAEQIKDTKGNVSTEKGVEYKPVSYSPTLDGAQDLAAAGYDFDMVLRDSAKSGKLSSATPPRNVKSDILSKIEFELSTEIAAARKKTKLDPYIDVTNRVQDSEGNIVRDKKSKQYRDEYYLDTGILLEEGGEPLDSSTREKLARQAIIDAKEKVKSAEDEYFLDTGKVYEPDVQFGVVSGGEFTEANERDAPEFEPGDAPEGLGLGSRRTAPRPFTALEIEQAAEVGVTISNKNGLPADENGDIVKTNAVTDFFNNLFSNPLKVYTKEYADVYLKEHEGVVEHDSLEDDTTTAAFGVKFSKGLKRKDYKSDAEFAAAVALKHKDIVKAKFKDKEWEALPDSVKYALVDLNFNVGKIGTTADKTTTEDMLLNTLSFVGMTTEDGTSASLIALAKRRAWNWNKASAETGLKEIAKIEQKQTANGGTEIKYLDAQGNIIKTVTNGRKPVKLNTDGTYTTITAMREVELKTNATDDDTVVAETTTNVEVQSGDTMSAIAAKNSLTLKELLAANPAITDASKIKVGQSIKIPTADLGVAV